MTITLTTKKDTNQEYHAHDSISASGLKMIYKKSVYHHLHSKYKDTPAMSLGSAAVSYTHLTLPTNREV